MKQSCVLLFLSLLLGHSVGMAQEEFKPFSEDEALKEIVFPEEAMDTEALTYMTQVKEGNNRRIDVYNLQKAKFKLINGDLKTARFLLGRISDKNAPLLPVKLRYLATIDFIEGKYADSLSRLKSPVLQTSSFYKQVCLLKLINFMALNDVSGVKAESTGCMVQTDEYSRNDQFWLDTMVKLKTRDQIGLKRNMLLDLQGTLSSDEMSRIWMKSGLYLNREDDLLFMLGVLPESSYQSKRLREIVGFLYLRKGIYDKALSFVDDIDSANSENIKGTYNLFRREFELAFGHFKLALQKKQDSANALERAIPLAWILRQWDDGLQMVRSSANRSVDQRNRKAIEIAFMIRQKKFEEAWRQLNLLRLDFKNNPPFEVKVMETYVQLILSGGHKKIDRRKIEDSAEDACKSYDAYNCWIALQFIQWENLGKTITRDEFIYTDKSLTIDSLKEKVVISPLKETVSVDQSDIEELDSNTITIPVTDSK